MLQVAYIREHKLDLIEGLKKRYFSDFQVIDEVLELDDKRKSIQKELDDINAKSNLISKEIGQLFQQGKRDEAEQKKTETGDLKVKSEQLKHEFKAVSVTLDEQLRHIPNMPNPLVPLGKTDEDNMELERFGTIPELGSDAQPHWEL
ncbi:MAG: serine--tRNA ligase, partial [Flavobacteriales bacterium]